VKTITDRTNVREGVVEAPREGMTGATPWGVEGRGYDRERSRSRETGEGRNGVDIDSTANARGTRAHSKAHKHAWQGEDPVGGAEHEGQSKAVNLRVIKAGAVAQPERRRTVASQ
jgi:hypothetical protein